MIDFSVKKKLNIGSSHPSGQYKNSEVWINIDYGEQEFGHGVLKIDATQMPDDWKNKFEEIHAVHVLEHINRNLRFKFVEECHRVLRGKGVLYIEVPDFEAVTRALVNAWNSKDEHLSHKMTTSIFGKQRYTGDQHHWGFTKDTLYDLIKEQGFDKIDIYTNKDIDQMISGHYKQEPILLAKAIGKTRS